MIRALQKLQRAALVCTVVLGAAVAPSTAAAAAPAPGDVLIADTHSNRVVLEPADGGPQTTFLDDGANQPTGVTVDRHGNVFVADNANRVIEIPANGGAQSTVASGLNYPVGVAVDAQGNVFIADRGNNRVLKVPAGGGAPTTVGTGLNSPQGVAVDLQGNVFIADRNNNRVVEVPAGGGSETTVGTGLNNPVGVAVDAAGDVLIADGGNARVVKVPAGGGAQTTIGTGLVFPSGVAVTAEGDLLIADPLSNQVIRVPVGGGAQSTLGTGLSLPGGVAAYAPPPTFTADSAPNARQGGAYSYTFAASAPAGQPPATFVVASGTLPSGLSLDPTTGVLSGTPTATGASSFRIEARNAATGTLSQPNTIRVGPPVTPGDVFIADGGGLLEYPVGGGEATVGNSLFSAKGLAIDANENVFVADAAFHRVVRVSADTQTQSVVTYPGLAGVLTGPYGLWVNAAGNDLFIANTDADRVDEVPPSGPYRTIGYGLESPRGVAVNLLGDVFIADAGNDRVVKVPAGGGLQTEVGSGLDSPNGIALDALGDVFIADTGNNRVVKVPADGGPQTEVGSGIFAPSSVALDAYGNVFVNDNGFGYVWKVPADGSPQIKLPRPLVPGGRFYLADAVAVYAPPPTFTADAPPADAGMGTSYHYTFRAATPAHEPAATFAVASGKLPPGLSLDSSTGELSGNPTKQGTYTFKIQTANVATGTLGASHVITVADSIATDTLSVTTAGTGAGTVSSTPSVISCPGTCAATFGTGTEVTLTADPASGATFAGWSGGGCSGTGPCTVTMDSDRAVTATFTKDGQHGLTVSTAGSGSGEVTSSPSGIDCGLACAASFPSGTKVALSATPALGSTFAGWSGGGCSGTGPCKVTLDAEGSITATFDAVPPGDHALWIMATGPGSGTVTSTPAGIACGSACSALFADGTAATLTAEPETGATFAGWSGGGCSGTGSCTVTMSADQTVTARFVDDAAAPVLSGFKISPNRYASSGRAVTLAIRFGLDMPAQVTVRIARLAKGRLVKGRCVKPTAANRRHRRCTRAIPLRGSLSSTGVAGGNLVRFNGRIGGRRLTPGTYRLTATATANGRIGQLRSTVLRVTG